MGEFDSDDHLPTMGFPGGSDSKASDHNAGDQGLIPGLGRFPGEGHGTTHSCVLSGESHGQRSLMCYSPWDCKELDMTERLTLSLHFIYH